MFSLIVKAKHRIYELPSELGKRVYSVKVLAPRTYKLELESEDLANEILKWLL